MTADQRATWASQYADTIMGTFAVPPLLLTHGSGCRVTDAAGVEYLDFLAGISVNALGHGHPALVAAIAAQAERLIHVSNLFASPPQLELAARLLAAAETGPAGRVFFANSGTEANEAAFKLARLQGRRGLAEGEPVTRTRILALDLSFHGRTMGAMAMTGKPAMRAPFEPMPSGVEHLPATVAALEAAMDERVAALIVEPIQGEAGVLPLPDGYLERARALCDEHGALLIIDEIQTGIGRTGKMFGYQHAGITPDAITLAKGLGGGVPIGAIVTFGAASELFTAGTHGTTFGGNPLATAAGNAVLAEIERAGLVARAAELEQALRAAIAGIASPLVAGVRGQGLLLGVELSAPVSGAVVAAALDAGLILNAPNESTIRLAPPLILTDADVADFAERFARALAAAGEASPTGAAA